ncbi:TIGR03826 family flagellar region protein [Paenibacillus enshidis]|uniref:TIGR03826 family flagellar region protein n=1 Tax=Paenibacillus enshidis TaxID=1458439 RepID=A0ABV5AR84_9BACL
MNIDNCPRCGKLYAVNIRELCLNCIKDIEREYEVCVQYLRDNRGSNIQELSEATEVSVKQITKFIREGRISVMNAPNMMYPCEVCGTLIREGHMCDSCRTRLTKELTEATRNENARDQGNNMGSSTYSVIDKKRSF